MDIDVEFTWRYAQHGEYALNYCRVLYAYAHPDTADILYIGKADLCSVKERLRGRHKEEIFEFFNREIGITEMGLLVGELILPEGRNYSSALLSDIESLLIAELQPPANIQCTATRNPRPGLNVICTGEWPHDFDQFIDDY